MRQEFTRYFNKWWAVGYDGMATYYSENPNKDGNIVGQVVQQQCFLVTPSRWDIEKISGKVYDLGTRVSFKDSYVKDSFEYQNSPIITGTVKHVLRTVSSSGFPDKETVSTLYGIYDKEEKCHPVFEDEILSEVE